MPVRASDVGADSMTRPADRLLPTGSVVGSTSRRWPFVVLAAVTVGHLLDRYGPARLRTVVASREGVES